MEFKKKAKKKLIIKMHILSEQNKMYEVMLCQQVPVVQLIIMVLLYFRLTEMWDYPKYGCPIKKGAKYFYLHNSGLQNQRCNILEAMTFVAYENA